MTLTVNPLKEVALLANKRKISRINAFVINRKGVLSAQTSLPCYGPVLGWLNMNKVLQNPSDLFLYLPKVNTRDFGSDELFKKTFFHKDTPWVDFISEVKEDTFPEMSEEEYQDFVTQNGLIIPNTWIAETSPVSFMSFIMAYRTFIKNFYNLQAKSYSNVYPKEVETLFDPLALAEEIGLISATALNVRLGRGAISPVLNGNYFSGKLTKGYRLKRIYSEGDLIATERKYSVLTGDTYSAQTFKKEDFFTKPCKEVVGWNNGLTIAFEAVSGCLNGMPNLSRMALFYMDTFSLSFKNGLIFSVYDYQYRTNDAKANYLRDYLDNFNQWLPKAIEFIKKGQ